MGIFLRCFIYFIFFRVMLSGVFVHRVFCTCCVRFKGAGVMLRFLWCTRINPQWRRKLLQLEWRFSVSLNKIYPYGAQEWNVNWISNLGGEK